MESIRHSILTLGRQLKKDGIKPKRNIRKSRDCQVRVYEDSELIRYEISMEHGDATFVTACLAKLRRKENLSAVAIERLDSLPAYWRDRLKGKKVEWKTPGRQDATSANAALVV